jgi:hypothetical protein
MVSPNYDENNSHSKQLNTPTSISTNDKNFDLAGNFYRFRLLINPIRGIIIFLTYNFLSHFDLL